jgi:tetratricopeptide (TPR) repeat protein
MKLRRILVPFLMVMTSLSVRGQKPEPLRPGGENEAVTTALEHLRSLEYGDAKEQLHAWADTHPADLRAWNYLATATLYQEMFQRGVLESGVYGQGGSVFKSNKVAVTPSFQQELFSVLDKAQGLAEQRLQNDPKDKDAMYWAGVSHGTRATYHFTLRKEYVPALHEATDAYKYHRDLLKLDPTYIDSYLIVGMNNYIVGSLPWYVKAMAALTGRHGDRAEGLQQVKRVTEERNYAREDARLMLAVLYQREKMYPQALSLYQQMAHSWARNYLLQCEVASLFGTLNDWRSAAQEYDAILAKHRAGESRFENFPTAKVLYQAGQAYERLQEYESALARYTEAGSQSGNDRYIYISELAAADLDMRLQRPDAARPHYQRVAEAGRDSEEGKSARLALKKLAKD